MRIEKLGMLIRSRRQHQTLFGTHRPLAVLWRRLSIASSEGGTYTREHQCLLASLGVLALCAGCAIPQAAHAAVTVGSNSTVKTDAIGSNDIAFQGGTLAVTNSGAFSNNGTLQSSNSAVVQSTIDAQGKTGTFSGVFSNDSASNSFQGALVITDSVGSGHIVFTGVNTYSGATTINAGATLALSGGGSLSLSSVVTNNGTLDISQTTNGASLVSLAGSGDVLLGSKSLIITNGSGSLSGVISGSGSLVVNGGALALDNANTYTGGTTVSRGTLQIGVGNSTGSILGDVSVGGTLAFYRADGISFDGLISGTGGLSQVGTGSLTLTRNETYSGATTISSGTLALSSTASIANSSSVAVSGTFDISATSGTSVKSLSGTGTVLLGNQSLTLTAASGTFSGVISGIGGVTLNSGTQLLSGANTYTGPTTVNGGTLQVGAETVTYNVANSGTFGFQSASAIAMSGVVSGSGAVLQSGGGTTTISAAQSYTGVTTISLGTLALAGSGSIASSSGLVNNGTFSIANAAGAISITALSGAGAVQLGGVNLILTNASGVFTGSITGSGGIQLLGGNQTLSGGNSFTGQTTISSGTLYIGGTSSLIGSSRVVNNGTLDISGVTNNGLQTTASIISLSGAGQVVLGGATLRITNASDTFTGGISGSGGITISGGTQVLSGVNTYTGVTKVEAGTLALTGSASLASGSIVDVGGTLDLSSASGSVALGSLSGSGTVRLGNQELTIQNGSTAFSGSISGGAGVSVRGGTQTFAGANSYTGGTLIDGGTLQLGDGVTNGSVVGNITNNGTLAFDQASDAVFSGIISGSGSVVQKGTGTVALTAANTYAGGTKIVTGTLQIGNGESIGSILGNISNDGILAFNRSDASTFDGTVSGTGGVSFIGGGPVTMTGGNSYTGATTIGATSSLILSANGSLASSSNVVDNGVLDVSAATNPTLSSLGGAGQLLLGAKTLQLTNAVDTFSGVISGSGGLTLTSGTQTLSGTNSYTGATTINGGTLAVNGSILSSSSVAVNSGGTLSGAGSVPTVSVGSGGTLAASGGVLKINGNLGLAPGSSYQADLTSTAVSRVSVTGSASLAGTLSVTSKEGLYQLGERVTLLTADGGISGRFSSSGAIVGKGAELSGDLSYDSNHAYLQVNLEKLSPLLTDGASANQISVVHGIDAGIAAGSTLPLEINRLGNLSASELPSVADRMSGEIGSSIERVGSALFAVLSDTVMDHLRTGAKDKTRPRTRGLQFWTSGSLGSAVIGGDGNLGSHKLSTHHSSFMAGVDWLASEKFRLGIAVSNAKADFRLGDALGQGATDAIQISSYGNYQFTPNIYGAFIGAAGFNNTSTNRTYPDATNSALSGKTNVLAFIGRYETGIRLKDVTPYLALQNEFYSVPGYTETSSASSAFALRYASRATNVPSLELGLRQSTEVPVSKSWTLKLSDRLAWSHSAAGRSRSDAVFSSFASSDFSTYGASPSKDSVLLSLGAEVQNTAGLHVRLRLDSAASSNSQSYTGVGAIAFTW